MSSGTNAVTDLGSGSAGVETPTPSRLITLRHVLCLAGDTSPTGDEAQEMERLIETDTELLYAECLRLLVGRRSVPEFAEQEWKALLEHRRELEEKLERPMSLQAAAIDFFCEARPTTPEVIMVPIQVYQDLHQEARIDPTTGLFAPSTFSWALDHEVRRARRYRRHLVMLLLEIDDLEQISTRRGQEYADFVLREVASLINENIRNTDTPARVDATCFAVLLHECKLTDGRILAERLRATLEKRSFSLNETDEGAHVTATIAVVGYPDHGDGGDRLMTKARALVAQSRDSGRNRVTSGEGEG
ncbi:MAG: GGDEF domain-containing protein [Proteobacteria bacterium]|nr:GGDEF domain-containing protein [Pseudomonadota bacterium]